MYWHNYNILAAFVGGMSTCEKHEQSSFIEKMFGIYYIWHEFEWVYSTAESVHAVKSFAEPSFGASQIFIA